MKLSTGAKETQSVSMLKGKISCGGRVEIERDMKLL